MNESQILAAIRKDLGREPDLVLWRLSQGGADRAAVAGQKYRAGLSVNGGSDLIGILTIIPVRAWVNEVEVTNVPDPVGRFFGLEIKTPESLARIMRAIKRGDVSKLTRSEQDQILFINLVRARGGFATWADGVDSGRAALERARAGASE